MAGEGDAFRAVFYLIGLQVRAVFWVLKMIFGIFMFWRLSRPAKPQLFTFSRDARFAHTHIVAGSGHGKTQLIQHMIETQDLEKLRRRKASVIVIDSQGDLIKTISRLKAFSPDQPENISDRVILIDPNDIEHPPCLNLFDFGLSRVKKYAPIEQEKILNGAIDLYEYMFGALLGAEMTNRQSVVFRYIARLMMVVPDATIYTLLDFMEEPETVRAYLSRLDIGTQRFFTTQFLSSNFDATRQQIAARLWGVLSTPALARMFSHKQNKLNMFEAMNSGSLILINTAKDFLKDDCKLFGRFMIALISQATQERAMLPEEERQPTYVYIDEAHEYFDETLESLFNSARKYRVGLILSHQNLGQFDRKLRDTVMASTAIKFVGGVSSDDARDLAKEMRTTPDFIQSMQKFPGETRFALFVKNQTPEAVEFAVPLGTLSRQPQMRNDELTKLLDANRTRFCAPFDKNLMTGSAALTHAGITFDLEDQRPL